MPWVMKKKGEQVCVYKEGPDKEAIGDPLGCHATEEEAKQQMAAMYASEPTAKAVKMVDGSEDVVEGPGMPWGGIFGGSDLDGQRFSARTDFAFEWFGKGARPLLYHHGMDGKAGTEVVGRVTDWETKDDLGVWTRAQLDKQSKYFAAIKDLVKQGKLYFSSGAMAHLVDVDAKGNIKRWPWVELSLTPTPSNLLAKVDLATAKAHLKAIDVELPLEAEPVAAVEPTPEPTAEHPTKAIDLKALSGSYEDLLAKLNAAINPPNPFAGSQVSDRWTSIEATFPGYFIASIHQNGEEETYQVAYTQNDDGSVTLGKMTPVEETYKPLAKSAGLLPDHLSDHALLVSAYAAALAQRTKDLGERRIKEGRVISAANRARLTECVTTMGAAMTALQTLLDATDTAKAEAKALYGRLLTDAAILDLESALN